MTDEERPTLPPAGWYDDPEGAEGVRRYWDGQHWTQQYQSIDPTPMEPRKSAPTQVAVDEHGPALPPAGWYDDPHGSPGMRRYWDGQEWTQQFQPAEARPSATVEAPQPLGDLSWLAIVPLAITGAIFVWEIASGATYESKLSNFTGSAEFGGLFAATELVDARDSFSSALVVGTVVVLLSSLAFLPWFHRAYRNLQRAGGGLRFTTGWAIGAWFVPILNLWRPKQIANDIWRGGSLDAGLGDTQWHQRPVSALVHWWWAVYLTWAVLGGIAWAILGGNDEGLTTQSGIDTEQTGVALLILADVIGIAGVVMGILLVRRITQVQDGAIRVAEDPGAAPRPYAPVARDVRSTSPGHGSPPTSSGGAAVGPGSPLASEGMTRYCSDCGAAVTEGDRYCSHCGNEIRA